MWYEKITDRGIWLLAPIFFFLLIRDITNYSIGYPDGDRILMDGVFLLDFMTDLPLTNIYGYTIEYFGQYPALSIGYRPPFFAFIESLFNAVFGINIWSSRLAVAAFGVMAIIFWFKLIREMYDSKIAFWSGLLFITTPYIVRWGYYTMAEIPMLALSLAAIYYFYMYMQKQQAKHLYWSIFFIVCSLWTKQISFVVIIWFFVYILLQRQMMDTLKRKEVWVSIVGFTIAVAPLIVMTLWLGQQHMSQTIGTTEEAEVTASVAFLRLTLDDFTHYYHWLIEKHLTLPILLLSAIGLLINIIRRDKKVWFFVSFIIVLYIVFSYFRAKNPRYTIVWIPMFCLFAVFAFDWLKQNKYLYAAGHFVLLAIVVFQIQQVYAFKPLYFTGYKEAAKYVLDHSHSPVMFFDGYSNGFFTYFIRSQDPQRSSYVIRGDKMLSSSSIEARWAVKIHVNSKEEIKQKFDNYGIEYIVVESENRTKHKIHTQLREYLKEGPFDLVKTIPIDTNRTVLMGQDILIYRYNDVKKITAEYMELHLPVVGKIIKVPMRKNVLANENND